MAHVIMMASNVLTKFFLICQIKYLGKDLFFLKTYTIDVISSVTKVLHFFENYIEKSIIKM